ncbi:GPI anchor transamidase like protein [Zymoseptoria brevis]|uniref:GPI anchor transamidase like protein n=1 Tax=Zymoseptoria brevis TaxID=1047168 RepID=A0A0F4GM06_9PEZI|nr:GPI anchor transamidase like protein [Zymoseptoria brevis]
MRLLSLPTALLALLSAIDVSSATHTSNWAVLVSTSRFWFNYRHLANTLSLYRTVKRLGIPDSQIILMLPDDMACNPRNSFPGSVFNDKSRQLDLYDDKSTMENMAGMGGIEVDYRGNEVTVENFIRLLTDRWPASHPTSKRLMTDDRSNILIYMTGHGGNEFLKFQDSEEISSFDLADAFEQMWEKKRYHELLFMIDTCQANTMYPAFYTPNIIATGSSAKDQSSYSHHADQDVGVAVIDRWTYYNLEFLETRLNSTSADTRLGELFDSYTFEKVHSDAGVRYDLFPGGEPAVRDRRVLDFFGSVQGVEVDASHENTSNDWKADLEALRKIMERQRTEMTEMNGTPNLQGDKRAGATLQAGQPGKIALNMAQKSEDWVNKIAGLGSLLVLGGAWVVSNVLTRTS